MTTIIKAGMPLTSGTGVRAVALELSDVKKQAEEYLAKAQQQANSLIEQAQQTAEVIRAKSQQEGQDAAREAIDQLLDEKIAQRLVTLQPALEQTVIELQRARQDWLAEWERGAVQLTTAIAARVVRREIEKKPEISTELIREALELATGFGQVKIHLNPQDHTALGSQVQTLAADLANLAPADIIADDSVTAGGCRVETQFGSIDQQIESQLERIAEELM
jgi:flagellar assembly protein FliH